VFRKDRAAPWSRVHAARGAGDDFRCSRERPSSSGGALAGMPAARNAVSLAVPSAVRPSRVCLRRAAWRCRCWS
jgi:hypothetical protein